MAKTCRKTDDLKKMIYIIDIYVFIKKYKNLNNSACKAKWFKVAKKCQNGIRIPGALWFQVE